MPSLFSGYSLIADIMHNHCAIFAPDGMCQQSDQIAGTIRLLVRSVRSKNSTMVVHFIINQIAAAVSDRTISLRAFASPILGAPVVSRLRSALHTDPSGRRPLRTDTISL